eukprot:TRINITY_DN1202_c0_g1_i11.p2 TRINITY_DN1202_c0_g1~~TRINITY_DN1202_c0_g1_i11.p2  ORF type:complete len:361 (+),score=111.58 TRINITY_DN1202_c0_g1_i11:3888-4970(+)
MIDAGLISLLPDEVFRQVLTYLNGAEICRLCQTCRSLRNLCDAPGFWDELIAADFGGNKPNFLSSSRDFYIMSYLTTQFSWMPPQFVSLWAARFNLPRVVAGYLDPDTFWADPRIHRHGLSNGSSPLHVAAESGHADLVGTLLHDETVAVDGRNVHEETPLFLAATDGREAAVSALLAAGANPNLPDESGHTPLAVACSKGHTAIVGRLLDAGASVDDANESGWTPLHAAASRGHAKVAAMLLARGATADARDDDNYTPLHAAAFGGFADIVELLTGAGAPVDAVDLAGWTPLHKACARGHDTIVERLIELGANIFVDTGEEQPPMDLAVAGGHVGVVRLLLDATARMLPDADTAPEAVA